MDHERLWRKYKSTEDIKYRNELIVLYQPLVRAVAKKISNKLPPNVEFDDLVGYGTFGLIDAIKRFDLERGFKFETFAMKRIQGAIYDGIRAMDWVPRTVRSQSKELAEAYADLDSDDPTTDDHLLEHLGWDAEKLQRVRDKSAGDRGMLSLDEPFRAPGGAEMVDRVSLSDVIADEQQSPGGQFELQELQGSLSEALSSLPEKEQIVLALYYHEQLKFSEIGEAFDVSESRVCQIHMNAIESIREAMMS
jgi:RNA polymerase sigma factor for flagellar operon FliA